LNRVLDVEALKVEMLKVSPVPILRHIYVYAYSCYLNRTPNQYQGTTTPILKGSDVDEMRIKLQLEHALFDEGDDFLLDLPGRQK
jgi:hypothetical protein